MILEHVYSNGAVSADVDQMSRESHGWRFGLNITQTWRDNHIRVGMQDKRVIVTEYNQSARGAEKPYRPIDCYEDGRLQRDLSYIQRTLPTCSDVLYFTSSSHGGWYGFDPKDVPLLKADMERVWQG